MRRLGSFALILAALCACSPDATTREPEEVASSSKGGGFADAAGERLRAAFPAQAARLLESERAFAEDEGSFEPAPSEAERALPGGISVRLPARGEEAITVRAGELSINVRELGAEGKGVRVGSAVAYPRRGGTSLWTATPDGFEEWLLLEPGVAHAGAPAAAWEVEGAALRKAGDAVEITDAAGVPRIRVRAPEAYAASGRAVPVWLDVTGARIEVVVDAGGEEVLVDPSWYSTASMNQARRVHGATLLSSGKVLVTGGFNGVVLSTAEVFDPALSVWSAVSPMSTPRRSHTITALPDGRVLVTGGAIDNQGMMNSFTETAEIYDPAGASWSPAAPMALKRFNHTATLLQTGKVLVTGGYLANGPSAEVYDPATNSWTPTGNLTDYRTHHAATLLPDGRVLLTGGTDPGGGITRSSAELYDPALNTFSAAAAMMFPRAGHSSVLLPNGKVLVAAGREFPNALITAELYDPALNTWTLAANLITKRERHTTTLLPSGEVLVTGGNDLGPLRSTERYDPAQNVWIATAPLNAAREAHTATLLPNGEVLAAGGLNNSTLASAEKLGFGPGAIGHTCATASDCASGFCVDTVCCSTACDLGTCDACSISLGADVNGTCKLLSNKSCNDANPCTFNDICTAGVCAGTTSSDGSVCNDGNGCTQGDTCQGGVCASGKQVDCGQSGPCFLPGSCDPAVGFCKYPYKPDGEACSDGNACTQVDTCEAGGCKGSSPVTCAPPDQCHFPGTCNTSTGACDYPPKSNFVCDDGDACTRFDACQNGVCVGDFPISCFPLDECHEAGVCDPATGMCSDPAKADGAACSDGNACTLADACQAGVCAGGTSLICAPLDDCHVAGVCDPATGLCDSPAKPDGVACDDMNACTAMDTCQAGVCTAGIPVVCPEPDECHTAGACEPATGVCKSPAKPDGTPCSAGTCQAGVCTPGMSSSGTEATSSSASGGMGGAGAGGGGSGEAEGCGCRAAGADDEEGSAGALLAILALGVASRRRALGRLRGDLGKK